MLRIQVMRFRQMPASEAPVMLSQPRKRWWRRPRTTFPTPLNHTLTTKVGRFIMRISWGKPLARP